MSKPELFHNYIILGPTLIWNDKEIFKQESKFALKHSTLNANVFTAIAKLDNEDITIPWTEFLDQVKSRNYKGLTLKTWIIEDEDHLSMLPVAVTRGLKSTLNKK